MEAYSVNLRERIVKSYQEGQQKSAIARLFMVSLSSVKRYIKRYQTLGHLHPTVQRRMQGQLNHGSRRRLARQRETHPAFTLGQPMAWWHGRHGEDPQVSESLLSRFFRHVGWTRKKKTMGAVERNEVDREAFRAVLRTLPVAQVVVLDEIGTRIGMVPLDARAPRGCRAYDHALQNYGRNVTLLASMSVDGMQAAMTVEGAINEAAFEACVDKVLLPTLHPGQIVILDNLSSHKSAIAMDLLTRAGGRVLFLPAYSPDLSPIEEAFSKFKAFLRRCRCRTIPAIAQGLDKLTAADARGYFAHVGFSI